MDTKAVLAGIESGKIGGFAFDVYEDEGKTQRKDLRGEDLPDPILTKMLALDQVIYTTHTAFYTDDAVTEIARITLGNLADFVRENHSRNEK